MNRLHRHTCFAFYGWDSRSLRGHSVWSHYVLLLTNTTQSGATPLLLLALLLFKLPVGLTLRTLLPLPELGVRNPEGDRYSTKLLTTTTPYELFFVCICISSFVGLAPILYHSFDVSYLSSDIFYSFTFD